MSEEALSRPASRLYQGVRVKRTRVCVALAITIAVAAIGFHLAARHLSDESRYYEQAGMIARDVSAAAERVILASRTRVEVLSKLESLRQEHFAEFDTQLRDIPHSEESWFIVYDQTGKVLINTLRPYGYPDLPDVTASRPEAKEFISKFIRNGHTIIGSLQWAPVAQAYAIYVTTPVSATGDRHYGLLEAIRQSAFVNILPDIRFPASWSGGIIDWQGKNIANSGGPEVRSADAAVAGLIFETAARQDKQRLLIRRHGLRIHEAVFHRSSATQWISFVQMDRFDPTLRLVMLLAALATAGLIAAYAADLGLVVVRREILTSVQGLTTALRVALERHAVTEQQLNRFWDQSADALCILRIASGGAIYLEATNRTFLQFMHVSHMRRRNLDWDQMDEERATLLRRCLDQQLPPGHTRRCLRQVRGEGKIRNYEIRLSAQKASVFVSIRDVTEIAQAKSNLRRIGAQLLAAQDSERRRIARDLHDSTAQLLSAASMYLARAQAAVPSPIVHISDAQELIERSQQEIRTIAYVLHPPLLEERGLGAALGWYSGRLARQADIAIDVFVDDNVSAARPAPEIELALFRIAQEALSNAIRHSGCSAVRIALNSEAGGLLLRVKDNGQGLPHPVAMHDSGNSAVIEFGIGIYGMSERIRQLRGWLNIQEAKPSGTLVEAWIPELQ